MTYRDEVKIGTWVRVSGRIDATIYSVELDALVAARPSLSTDWDPIYLVGKASLIRGNSLLSKIIWPLRAINCARHPRGCVACGWGNAHFREDGELTKDDDKSEMSSC